VIALLTLPLMTTGIMLGGKFGSSRLRDAPTPLDLDDDLPCPWCFAATDEQDRTCRSCGRQFGTAHVGNTEAAQA